MKYGWTRKQRRAMYGWFSSMGRGPYWAKKRYQKWFESTGDRKWQWKQYNMMRSSKRRYGKTRWKY